MTSILSPLHTTTRHAHLSCRAFTLLIAALLLAGCATTGDMMEKLNTSLRGYEKAIRWAKFDAAYSYHKWAEGEQASLPPNMENIRVTRFETTGEKFDAKNKTMKRTVKLRYYNTENQREVSMKYHQEWKYFEDSKRWYLTSTPLTFQ